MALSIWIYLAGLLIAAGGTFVLAVYTAAVSDGDRTLQVFVVLLLSVVLWTAGQGGRLLAITLGWKLFWQNVLYAGVASTAVTWLVFTALYTGQARYVSARTVMGISIVPAFTLALLFTNPLHHLYYESASLIFVGPTPVLTTTAGPFWWVWFGYAYLLMGVGIVLLIQFAVTAASLYRAQATALVLAGLLPLGLNVIFVFSLFSTSVLDLTPLAFAMSMLFLFAAVFFGRFLDLIPISRDSVLRTFEDGILVLNEDGQIVNANPAARSMLSQNTESETIVGEELSTVEPTLMVSTDQEVSSNSAGVVRGFEAARVSGGVTEWFWIRRVDITTATAKTGSIVTLTDITDKKRFERRLRKLQLTHQRLIAADDESTITDIAIQAASEVLDLPITGFWRLDETGMVLEPESMTEPAREVFGDGPALGRERLVWEALSDQEPKTEADLRRDTDDSDDRTHVRATIHVPVGRWGILSSGTQTRAEFEDTNVDLLRLLATAVERALNRMEREQRIRDLHRKTSSLMRAESPEDIAREAVETAEEVLDFPLSGIHLLNDNESVLAGTAVTSTVRAEFGGAPTYRRSEGNEVDNVIWEVFETGETLVIGDVEESEIDPPESLVRSVIVASLGDYGVFITSSPVPHAVDQTVRALVDLFATTVTAALDRVERERALRQRERDLRHQNKRLEEFTSVISHDLRSPLNQVNVNLEMVVSEYDDNRLDSALEANERAEDMIEDLLTLARQGKIVEDPNCVRLSEVVQAAWLSVPAGDKTLDQDDDLGTLAADRPRLRQVFENLFRNAVEHGGTTVRVGRLGDEVGVYVADDGSGVPEDQREDIFEHGYTTAHAGTGFGLAIVKRIVEAHGWQIRVTDSAENGARFEIFGVQTEESDRK